MGQCMSTRDLSASGVDGIHPTKPSAGSEAAQKNSGNGRKAPKRTNTSETAATSTSAASSDEEQDSKEKASGTGRPKLERSAPCSSKQTKDALSDSAHRRKTLQYISARRLELEREVSHRLNIDHTSFTRDEKTKEQEDNALTVQEPAGTSVPAPPHFGRTKSKEAVRMPNMRSLGGNNRTNAATSLVAPTPHHPPSFRTKLQRQNSWFTMGTQLSNMTLNQLLENDESTTEEMGESTSFMHDSIANHSSWGELGYDCDDDNDPCPPTPEPRRAKSAPMGRGANTLQKQMQTPGPSHNQKPTHMAKPFPDLLGAHDDDSDSDDEEDEFILFSRATTA